MHRNIRFKRQRTGQATMEYAILILTIVIIVIGLSVVMRDRIKAIIEGPIGNYVSTHFFNAQSLHSLPIKIPQ